MCSWQDSKDKNKSFAYHCSLRFLIRASYTEFKASYSVCSFTMHQGVLYIWTKINVMRKKEHPNMTCFVLPMAEVMIVQIH